MEPFGKLAFNFGLCVSILAFDVSIHSLKRVVYRYSLGGVSIERGLKSSSKFLLACVSIHGGYVSIHGFKGIVYRYMKGHVSIHGE